MANIQQYWSLVAEHRAKLLAGLGVRDIHTLNREQIQHIASQKETWIISVDRPLEGINAGSISGVTVEVAARRIVEGTHRLATSEETEKFHADQKTREQECNAIEFRRRQEKGGVQVSITREDAAELGMVPAAKSKK